MTYNELKEKISEGGGVWKAKEDFIFKKDDDDETIHFASTRPNETGSGFILEHVAGDFKKAYVSSSYNLGDVNNHIRFSQMLVDILELDIKIEAVVTRDIEKIVEKAVFDPKHQGMIEAYEKILKILL